MKSRLEFGESQESVLEDLFSYHAPTADKLPKYEAIREGAKAFAKVILDSCPNSADKSASLRFVLQAMMTANASVALDGRGF